jgi:hypothetical protein
MEQFHWSDVAGNDWNGLSCAEVKSMLWSCAGRRIVETRAQEILANPKLDILQTILELACRSRCSDVQSKPDRRMLMRLRGGTAPFEIEAGRWKGVPRENRICKQCQLSEIEDVTHWLLRCESQADSTALLVQKMMISVPDFTSLSDKAQAALILDQACQSTSIRKILCRMWNIRF